MLGILSHTQAHEMCCEFYRCDWFWSSGCNIRLPPLSVCRSLVASPQVPEAVDIRLLNACLTQEPPWSHVRPNVRTREVGRQWGLSSPNAL